ncbi:MAG: hypothetical protein K2W80_04205 [Burkholderiales bacterium]|nr:hypothetical protein [Burkholderiales bacterium]
MIRRGDLFIPTDSANPEYREYLAWVAAGNTAAPYVAPTQPERRIPCTPLYARRVILTPAEVTALHAAAMSSVQMAVWLADLAAASYIVPADPELQTGLDGLIALGILSQQRKTEILAALTLGMPANWGTA